MGREEFENSATFYRGEMQAVKGTPFGEGLPNVYTFTRYKFLVHSKSRGWLKQRFLVTQKSTGIMKRELHNSRCAITYLLVVDMNLTLISIDLL